MAIQHVNAAEAKKLLDAPKIILTIGAEWCGPCRMMVPQFEALSNLVPVIKVDIDKNREFATEMGVQSIPTTFIYHNGKKTETFVGFVPKEQIEAKL